eukprot:366026-Chlamydomonas_euryale.AAC.10
MHTCGAGAPTHGRGYNRGWLTVMQLSASAVYPYGSYGSAPRVPLESICLQHNPCHYGGSRGNGWIGCG